MKDEDGHTGALRILKMSAENPANAKSLIDAIKDAGQVQNQYNDEFLTTVAAFAIEGWKNA